MADSKISALSDGTTPQGTDQFVVARSSSDVKLTWTELQAASSGHEFGYTQITSTVNVVSTTESSGTTIISPGAITFDGSPVICEFFGHLVSPNTTSASLWICLFESSTQITRLGAIFVGSSSGNNQVESGLLFRYRFTPTAASHTYTITAFASSTTGTPKVEAGSGGTNGIPPAFVRFIKV